MRYFTHSEAEALLPQIQKIVATALEIKRKAEEKMEALARLERNAKAAPDKIMLERAQIEFLAQNIEDLLRQIQDMGAFVKGLDPTLVDFPSRIKGEEVYLCWKHGEPRIEHYHGIDEGFAGRKPLPQSLLRH